MNNRHERRKAGRGKARSVRIRLDEINDRFDVIVEGKGTTTMIQANAAGREAVSKLWPHIEWSRDEMYERADLPPDWQFAHVVVTKLPAHLEEKVALVRATEDGRAAAVAFALVATGQTVLLITGLSSEVSARLLANPDSKTAREQFAAHAKHTQLTVYPGNKDPQCEPTVVEYCPPGTPIQAPPTVQ
jgi:hypothetical protein